MSQAGRLARAAAVPLLGMMIGAGPALALPTYSLLTTIGIPASPDNTVGGAFKTFDISSFDPATQLGYVGDRSNAAVDILSAATNSYVGRIGGTGHMFTGQLASNDASGPDGVLAVNVPGLHALYAGNGDSTLHAFSLPSNAAIATIPTGPASANRVDELAFNPITQQVLASNNAATPSPFVSLIDTATNTVVKKIVFDGTNGTPNATNGVEQPAYNPVTKTYFASIPQINGSGPGGVAELDAAGNMMHVFDFSTFNGGSISACSPTGLVAGSSGELLVGCGTASQSIILNPTANGGAGSIKTFTQVSGEDQVAYDPTSNLFFLAAGNNPGGPILGIIDGATDTFLQGLSTVPGAHSVAVDPISGEAIVPFGASPGNTTCASGCVGVFALASTNVPEPGSLPLLATAIAGVAAEMLWQRRRTQRG